MIFIAIILNSVVLINFLIFSGYWALIFIRRIYCCKKYKRGLARFLSDDSGYINEQFYYHYETEIWKNVLLLLITFSEIIATIFFFLAGTIPHYLSYRQLGNSTLELPFTDCTRYKKPALNQINIIYLIVPYLSGLNTIAGSAQLFILAFGAYLMNYLILRIKKIKYPYYTSNYRVLLTITTLLSAVIIITGFIQYTAIISNLLFFISTIIYCCIFVKTSKRFKLALLQRALERLTQHGSNKEEMRQYRYCKHTMNIICWGYILIISSETLLFIPELLVSTLFYGDCYFPFNLFPSLNYVLQTEKAIEVFSKALPFIELIFRTFSFISIVIAMYPFVLITVCIWIKHILKCIRGNNKIKYSTVNTSLE